MELTKREHIEHLGYLCYSLASYGFLNENGNKIANSADSIELESYLNKRYLRVYIAKVDSYATTYINAGIPKDIFGDTIVELSVKLARRVLYLLSVHNCLSEKGMKILIELNATNDNNVIFDLLNEKEYDNCFASHFTTEIKEIIEDRKNTEKK
jgi:hypothetical protein